MSPSHRVHQCLASTLLLAGAAGACRAHVSVSLAPEVAVAQVGQTVGVRVQLSSATPATVAAAQVMFSWDPSELRLIGLSNVGAAILLTSGLPRPDPHGLNEAVVPADGNALYIALARLGRPLSVSEEGESVLLTTLLFEALTPTADAEVTILTHGGTPPGQTQILDGVTPNTDITGSLSGASVTIIPAPSVGPVAMLALVAFSRRRHRA